MSNETLALECFSKVEERAPSAEAFGKIGVIAFRLKKFELARSYLKRSLMWDGTSSQYMLFLAKTLESLKQFSSAAETYKKAILLDPIDDEARAGLKRIGELTRKVS